MIQADWVEAAAVADFGRAIRGKGAVLGGVGYRHTGEKGQVSCGVDLSFDPCIDSIASQKKVPALKTISLSPPQQGHFSKWLGASKHQMHAVAHLPIVT